MFTIYEPYGKVHNVQNLGDIIIFYKVHREITDSLFDQLTIRKLAIDNSIEDWERYNQKIASFLSLPNLESVSTPLNKLEDFVGRYKEITANHEWCIASDGIHLYFDDSYQKRLVHKADNIFYVEGMCLELSFETDEKGSIKQIKCYGNEGGQEATGMVWAKIG